jgi:hypothetical protein
MKCYFRLIFNSIQFNEQWEKKNCFSFYTQSFNFLLRAKCIQNKQSNSSTVHLKYFIAIPAIFNPWNNQNVLCRYILCSNKTKIDFDLNDCLFALVSKTKRRTNSVWNESTPPLRYNFFQFWYQTEKNFFSTSV